MNTTSSFDLVRDEPAITKMVSKASDRALDWYRKFDRSTEIENKLETAGAPAGFDPVTEADRSIEAELRAEIGRHYPDHAIVGEEFGSTGSGDYSWIIDPIDGTRAFITGQPMWGTLVGLRHMGAPIAGWLHTPVMGETFVGTTTGGYMIDRQGERRDLTTSSVERLDDAIVTSTHPEMFAPGEETDRYNELMDRTRMTRFSGDCVNYALVALGLVDLVVENGLAPYDIVPLIPIVEAAGGIITDLEGRPPLDGGYVVAAANEAIHAAALKILAG